MKKLQKNRQSGITLIALVITIIILIILAGVAIKLSFGENGLFNRAKYAKQEYEIAQEKEKLDTKIAEVQIEKEGKATINDVVEALKNETGVNYYIAGNKIAAVTTIGAISDAPKELYVVCNDKYQFKVEENLNTEFISIVDVEKIGEVVPPATEDTEVGTKVETPSNWKTETPDYVEVESGKIITKSSEVASVYAVSVGGKDVVPIPKGFYYVGGNLQTGVVISDNEEDSYEKNKRDMSSYEDTVNLVGNQFVWIPCTTSEYKKCDTWNGTKQKNGTLANAEWDTTTTKSGLMQIEKYGGFYVARYEAGLAETITEFTTDQIHTGANQVYNLDGTPQSKAGMVPWIFIDWTHSKANAESMYNNNYVSSGLIVGTQWDVILNIMLKKSEVSASDLVNSNSWGNYLDNSISYNGRLAKIDYNSVATLKPFGTKGEGKTNSSGKGDLLTTGASSIAEKYHIFDLAGNVWEWTEETSIYATSEQYRVLRGGSCDSSWPVCYRHGKNTVKKTSFNVGFRVVLYIK